MKFAKDSPEWNFFRDFYNFVEKYYEVKGTSEYHDGFIKDSQEIADKYKKTHVYRLATKLFVGMSEYVIGEERNRDGK